ncbi:uncharacterized protein B0I36DRAFT_16502 [Microdochium trichocladiopsis]|uniref:EthD domain-containing protein n=1 Tax=Microdochium trichocladiopsis TaxID=1682393 RepID=A0A9P8YFP2_9PEZI|nr:uncharacterized protein B0I36DRAFT_16502 [Microdochium trichocladiopsis]KAH7040892.1 hypothetical protein B0I36DRAFT_16502 [Microdochium trichocladiopsis]
MAISADRTMTLSETNPRLKDLKGPGLLWVGSKIKKRDLLSWPTFLSWYDTEMLPAMVGLKGIRSAMRSTARDQSEEWPTLCIFVMDDLSYLHTPEVDEGMPGKSKFLPGGGQYMDLADFDCRFYNILSSYEPAGETTMGMLPDRTLPPSRAASADVGEGPLAAADSHAEKTRCLLIVTWDFRAEVAQEEFDEFYYKAHNPMMTKFGGFLRSTRYKLDHGWWSSGDGAELPCPDWLQICEFSTLDIDKEAILEQNATQSEKLLEIISKTIFTIEVYTVDKMFGDKTMFHGWGRGEGRCVRTR